MTDGYIFYFCRNMNERQMTVFIAAVEKIAAAGWTWQQAPVSRLFQVWDGGVLIGEGVTLDHALESAEGAK